MEKPRWVRFVTPEKGCQRAFLFNEVLCPLCIVDDRLDFAAMTNNAFILEQTIDVALGKARDPIKIEMMERVTEVLALGKNGAPAQARLKPFETQFLEQTMVITDREPPLGIVIIKKLRCGDAPVNGCLKPRINGEGNHRTAISVVTRPSKGYVGPAEVSNPDAREVMTARASCLTYRSEGHLVVAALEG